VIDKLQEEIMAIRLDLNDHVRRFESHEKIEKEWYAQSKEAQEENAMKIDTLCQHSESLLEAWATLGGAMRFGIAIGKFTKWAGSFAVIIAIIDWLTKHDLIK